MFADVPEPTPYDLRWRMLGVDVRVNPWFWLMAALLGWSWLDHGVLFLALWIACVFVSVLIHEFGHVLAGRAFGADGSVWLYGFGGMAMDCSRLAQRWQRVAVYLAGPFAGFAFFAFVMLAYQFVGQAGDRLDRAAVLMLFWVNLIWGVLNLIPVLPLDGGQVMREFFGWLFPQSGLRWALLFSTLVAGGLAAFALMKWNDRFMALFFGLMAFQSFASFNAVSQFRSRGGRFDR